MMDDVFFIFLPARSWIFVGFSRIFTSCSLDFGQVRNLKAQMRAKTVREFSPRSLGMFRVQIQQIKQTKLGKHREYGET